MTADDPSVGARPVSELIADTERLRAIAAGRVPGRLAQLVTDRVSQLHGVPTPSSLHAGNLSPAERAVLDVAEQMLLDVHALTDEQMARLAEAYTPPEVVAITVHIALTDAFVKLAATTADSDEP